MIGNIVAGTFSAGVAPVTSSYESIATVTVGSGGSSSIDFTSIPSTYKHLQLRVLGRYTNPLNIIRNAGIRFNSDTGSNYAVHYLAGDGSSAFTDAASSNTFMYPVGFPDGSVTANTFGVAVIDILDYASTSKYKTLRALSGTDANGSGQIRLGSGLWLSTSAITSITLAANNFSITFGQYTHAALYGIKD